MPVLIIGAACDVGRHLARLIIAEGGEARVYIREDDSALRAEGCKVAVGEYDDLGRLESAMEQVHTVVHLATEAEPPHGRARAWMVDETTDVAVLAAVSADVHRFLLLSIPGADPSSDSELLGAYGRGEDRVRRSGIGHAILRCAPVVSRDWEFGRSLIEARTARTPIAPGSGTQRLNPIAPTDVARALYLADARDGQVAGTWELGGPDSVTYDALVGRATGKQRVGHKRNVPGLSREGAHVLSRDLHADPRAFVEAFPMTLTPLDDALASLA